MEVMTATEPCSRRATKRAFLILGHPFAGKTTLAQALAPLVSLPVVAMTKVRDVIERGVSEKAVYARGLVTSGCLIPSDLFGALLAEAVGSEDALIVGRPRTEAELDAFTRYSDHSVSVIHLEATQALVDERMAAVGLGPSEKEHPGALARLRAALEPVLVRAREAGSLLTLDASSARAELVDTARKFVQHTRSVAG